MCESQVITVCQDIADSLDNGDKIDAIIIDFSKAFDLVPHGRLLTKIANSGVDSKVVVRIREFLLGRTQRVRVGGREGQISALDSEKESSQICTSYEQSELGNFGVT